MKNNPNVSIYILTYLNSAKRGEVLRKTVEWALQQDYPNFEVVVSDNASPYSVVDALATITDSRLKVCLNKENAGFTGNINRCLEHCRFDIIKPLCDDDLLHVDFLSTTVPLVSDDSFVVVDVNNFPLGEDPEGIDLPLGQPPVHEIRPPGYGRDIWKLPYIVSCIPSGTIFTRKLFSDLGGYDAGTGLSDWDFFVEACLFKKVVHVMAPLCQVAVWEATDTSVRQREEPYYWPIESLYSNFRVLRCHNLSRSDAALLLFNLWRHFIWESFRLFKYPFSRAHHVGYGQFFRRFFWLLTSCREDFTRVHGKPRVIVGKVS